MSPFAKRKTARIAALFVLATSLLLSLSCHRDSDDSLLFSVGGAPTELLFWERRIREFEARNGIRVELRRQPSDADLQRQGLIVALDSRQERPDIFLMDVAWISLFAESGWLEPLDDTLDRSLFFDSVTRAVDLYREQLIAVPVYMDTGLLYYRKDLLERFHAEPPRSWEELRRTALHIQGEMRKENPRFYGFVWQGMQYEGLVVNFLEFAGSNGGFFDEEGRFRLNREANRKALAFMRDLIHTDAVSPPDTYTGMREEEARLFFQRGDALFERNWPYAYALHAAKDSPVRGRFGVAPLPGPEGSSPAPALGGWHGAVSRFSRHKREALLFLVFLTSRETQQKMREEMGWNPGRKDLYPGDGEGDERDRILRLSFRRARPRPPVPYYTRISSFVQRELSGALSERVSPEEALSSADESYERLLRRYGMAK